MHFLVFQAISTKNVHWKTICFSFYVGANPMDRFDIVFWVGDLNFRLRKTREEIDFLLTKKSEPSMFLQADELTEAMNSGMYYLFVGFSYFLRVSLYLNISPRL